MLYMGCYPPPSHHISNRIGVVVIVYSSGLMALNRTCYAPSGSAINRTGHRGLPQEAPNRYSGDGWCVKAWGRVWSTGQCTGLGRANREEQRQGLGLGYGRLGFRTYQHVYPALSSVSECPISMQSGLPFTLITYPPCTLCKIPLLSPDIMCRAATA